MYSKPVKRPSKRGTPEASPTLGTCTYCGKQSYKSRNHAKDAARRYSHTRLSPYRCPTGSGMWHLGHLPLDVVHGVISRDDVNQWAQDQADIQTGRIAS